MKKAVVLVMALAALLAVPGVALADVPASPVTIVADTLATAETYVGLVSDYPYMFLHPTGIPDLYAWANAAGHGAVYSQYAADRLNSGNIQLAADNNTNGIPDATEFKVIEELINNHGGASDPLLALHNLVHEGYKTNMAQLSTALVSGQPVGDLGGLAAGLVPNLYRTIAAYGVLGDGAYERFTYNGTPYGYGYAGSWGVVAETINGMAGYGSGWNTGAPDPTNYGRVPAVSACGDADGDGVNNINEYYAAADATAYVAAVLSAATTATAADPGNVCAAVGTGYSFGTNLFYNPTNGSVYAVLGELPWPVGESLAVGFTLAGTPIAGHLARVNDAAENSWIATTVIAGALAGSGVWVGGSDQTTEGTWKWADDGATFWQGTWPTSCPTPGTGAGVGGLYNNFGCNEPNNSSDEDYLIIGNGGGWNDDKVSKAQYALAEFTNGGAGYADTTGDGVPEFWAALMNLTDIQITGAPAEVLAAGVAGHSSAVLTASSSDVLDTAFTWSSSDDTIATVTPLTALTAIVTATGPGTAIITATANSTHATNTVSVTVRAAEWYEVCNLVSTFPGEGAVLADATGAPYETWDFDGDAVLDAWQLQLLAYDICENPASTAATEFAANKATVAQMGADLSAVAAWLGTGSDTQLIAKGLAVYAAGAALQGSASEQATLMGALTAAVGAGNAGTVLTLVLTYPQVIGQVCSGLGGTQGDLQTYGPAIQYVLSDVLAGLMGMSSEAATTIPALLSLPDLAFMLNSGTPFTSNLTNVPGIGPVPTPLLSGDVPGLLAMPLFPVMNLGAQTDVTILGMFSAYFPGLPKTAALYNAALAFATKYAELGSDSFVVPTLPVYTRGAKLTSEPFSGLGDYDGDGVTNQEVAAIISAQGGSANDFVNAAANIDPFWAGNPGLPLAGIAGLSALAMALGGTAVLRRKK